MGSDEEVKSLPKVFDLYSAQIMGRVDGIADSDLCGLSGEEAVHWVRSSRTRRHDIAVYTSNRVARSINRNAPPMASVPSGESLIPYFEIGRAYYRVVRKGSFAILQNFGGEDVALGQTAEDIENARERLGAKIVFDVVKGTQ